jgi:hypothetical protein
MPKMLPGIHAIAKGWVAHATGELNSFASAASSKQ